MNRKKKNNYLPLPGLSFTYLFVIVFLSILLFLGLSYHQVNRIGEKVAYLKDGNIWIADESGNNSYQLTTRRFEPLTNATRIFTPWCVEGDPRDCSSLKNTEVDMSQSYFDNFFQQLSLSPDGEHLAAFAYNDSIKNAIEANTKELNQKYFTGEYWNPQHPALYIFDLKNRKTQTFDLENKFPQGKSLLTNVQIKKIIWSPQNTYLTFHSLGGTLYKFDLKKGEVSLNLNNNQSSIAEWPVHDHASYYPRESTLYYVDGVGISFARDTILRKIHTYKNAPSPETEFTIRGERFFGGPFTGNNHNLYLVTRSSDSGLIKIYEYQIPTHQLNILKEISPQEFNTEFDYYSKIPMVSPNGEFLILKKHDDWGIYQLNDFQKVKLQAFDPYSLKWSLDGNNFISCTKNPTIFNILNGSQTKLDTNDCLDSNSDPTFDWNYLD